MKKKKKSERERGRGVFIGLENIIILLSKENAPNWLAPQQKGKAAFRPKWAKRGNQSCVQGRCQAAFHKRTKVIMT